MIGPEQVVPVRWWRVDSETLLRALDEAHRGVVPGMVYLAMVGDMEPADDEEQTRS